MKFAILALVATTAAVQVRAPKTYKLNNGTEIPRGNSPCDNLAPGGDLLPSFEKFDVNDKGQVSQQEFKEYFDKYLVKGADRANWVVNVIEDIGAQNEGADHMMDKAEYNKFVQAYCKAWEK